MSRPRTVAVAALLGLPLAAVPVHADHTASPAALTSATTIATSLSGTSEVTLHRDARIDTSPDAPGVTIKGSGRFVGLWLQASDTERPDHLTSYRLPRFAGGEQITYGSAADGTCRDTGEQLTLTPTCPTGSTTSVLLRAGNYRLTVLTDNRPVTIQLALRGLPTGDLTIKPQRHLASVQKQLPERDSLPTTATFGDAVVVDAPVDTFVVATATAKKDAVIEHSSLCRRTDDGHGLPLAYGPDCTTGSSGQYQYRVNAGDESLAGAGGFASSADTDHSGPVGLGGSFTGDSVDFRDALGVWLERG